MTWYFKSVWSQQWDTQKVLSSRRDTTKVSTLRRHIWKVVFSAWPRLKTDLKTSDVRPKTFQKRFQDNKIILKKLEWDIIKVTKSVMLLEKSYPQGDHILTDDPKIKLQNTKINSKQRNYVCRYIASMGEVSLKWGKLNFTKSDLG